VRAQTSPPINSGRFCSDRNYLRHLLFDTGEARSILRYTRHLVGAGFLHRTCSIDNVPTETESASIITKPAYAFTYPRPKGLLRVGLEQKMSNQGRSAIFRFVDPIATTALSTAAPCCLSDR
jgi:hypothetical protein